MNDLQNVRQELAQLQAQVTALELWRAHQSDLLDGLLNGRHGVTGEAPRQASDGSFEYGEIDDTSDEPFELPPHDEGGDELIEWVHTNVAAVIARPLRGEIKWCLLWWEHPEAIFRFTALRRAWTELAQEPGTGLSIYIRDHLDPCLRELTSPLGPFSDCSHNERFKALTGHAPLPTLPISDPPAEADHASRG